MAQETTYRGVLLNQLRAADSIWSLSLHCSEGVKLTLLFRILRLNKITWKFTSRAKGWPVECPMPFRVILIRRWNILRVCELPSRVALKWLAKKFKTRQCGAIRL